jgi:hypothetical protein
MKKYVLIAGILLLGSATAAQAQWGWGRYGYPYGYRHASTAEEGIQRGYADVVRSAGIKNLLDSQAANNWEDARRKYFDNRVYGVQKYFEMREVNRQARAAERGPRPTMQQLIRISDARKPDRLDSNELDPLIGNITWPPSLSGDAYKAYRARLEELYGQRAAAGYLNGEELAEVRSLTDGMEAQLKGQIRDLPPSTYTDAKNFIRSLRYESLLKNE